MLRFLPVFVVAIALCVWVLPPVILTLPTTTGPLQDSNNITDSSLIATNETDDDVVSQQLLAGESEDDGEEDEEEEEVEVEETAAESSNSCPACCARGDSESCTIHNGASHVTALDFRGSDWHSCRLPQFPRTNERVCFRTSVFQCGEVPPYHYTIHLKRRNETDLYTRCNETETRDGRLSQSNSTVFFHSPHYGCINYKNKALKYRSNEFCLYNISVPNCPSGSVDIRTESSGKQKISPSENGTCQDYLQFYAGDYVSSPVCGDLRDSNGEDRLPVVPSTNLLAVFWTNRTRQSAGFKLTATCIPRSST